LQNKYNLNIICNDKFTPLYNFWKTCKENNDLLCNSLYDIRQNKSITKDDFINYRNIIMNENDTLKQSIYYFIINRCSFSGSTLSGGYSKESSIKRFTISSIDRIKSLNLDKFKIYNKDFEDFIHTEDNTLLFLDPPYYLEKLKNVLSNKKNWIMTYNNCKYIRDMYKGFKLIEICWSYGMNKTKKSSELVIISK